MFEYKELVASLECECDSYVGYTCSIHRHRQVAECALEEIEKLRTAVRRTTMRNKGRRNIDKIKESFSVVNNWCGRLVMVYLLTSKRRIIMWGDGEKSREKAVFPCKGIFELTIIGENGEPVCVGGTEEGWVIGYLVRVRVVKVKVSNRTETYVHGAVVLGDMSKPQTYEHKLQELKEWFKKHLPKLTRDEIVILE